MPRVFLNCGKSLNGPVLFEKIQENWCNLCIFLLRFPNVQRCVDFLCSCLKNCYLRMVCKTLSALMLSIIVKYVCKCDNTLKKECQSPDYNEFRTSSILSNEFTAIIVCICACS